MTIPKPVKVAAALAAVTLAAVVAVTQQTGGPCSPATPADLPASIVCAVTR